MDLKLAGSKVIVTGGTKGLGLAIAEGFAAEGCRVAVCSRDNAHVMAAVTRLKNAGAMMAAGLPADINDTLQFRDCLETLIRQLGGLDIFVSNVSAQSREWVKNFHTDITGCVNSIDTIIPYLKKSAHPAIVSVASQAALLSTPNYKPYGSLKAALIHYMSSLSRELGSSGIRVNSVSPGEIYFEGGTWAKIKLERPEKYLEAVKKSALGRLGTPGEVANAVVFLSSPAASFISGTNLLIDGAGKQHVQY